MLDKIFEFPNPRVTQEFGERPSVYKQFGLKGHNGIDFTHPQREKTVGTPVYSVSEGKASVVNQGSKGYGLYVRITNDKHEFTYAHLSKAFVGNGANVKVGDKLGDMGNTGFSSGPHLHFGIREVENGKIKNYDNGYKGAIDPRIIEQREKEEAQKNGLPFKESRQWALDLGLCNDSNWSNTMSKDEIMIVLQRLVKKIT